MKWSESTVTKLLITDVESLDPVTVYIENYEQGKGKLTIEVYGESWSSYWGAMGGGSLEQFVLSCDNHYLAKNLASLSALYEDDYESFIDACRKEVLRKRKDKECDKKKARELWNGIDRISPEKEWFHDSYNHEFLHSVMGCEWWHSIPTKSSSTAVYLYRILDALKECLKEREGHKQAA